MDCKTPTNDLANNLLSELLLNFEERAEVQAVNFRDLASWVPYGERATHMIHLYPAKLLPHIPVFFLANNILSKPGDLVFDPFCGSGTTLLEALLAGRQPIGADSNPLARLISKVKITQISSKKLNRAFLDLKEHIEALRHNQCADVPDVVNIDLWFYPHVQEELSRIKSCIELVKNEPIRNFFKVSFSNTVKRVSLADPRMPVPVRIKPEKYEKSSLHYRKAKDQIATLKNIDVISAFYKCTESNLIRLCKLESISPAPATSHKILEDARNIRQGENAIAKETVQLIITSPPYGGAQKYIRSSSLNLGWLELCESNQLRKFERLSIGREHYQKEEYGSLTRTGIREADAVLERIFKINKLRAHIAANYLLEMEHSIIRTVETLRYGGYFVLVIGNNQVCGHDFQTKEYLKFLLLKHGLSLILELADDIHSRGLMTKRNKTAGVIVSESVMLFTKNHD